MNYKKYFFLFYKFVFFQKKILLSIYHLQIINKSLLFKIFIFYTSFSFKNFCNFINKSTSIFLKTKKYNIQIYKFLLYILIKNIFALKNLLLKVFKKNKLKSFVFYFF